MDHSGISYTIELSIHAVGPTFKECADASLGPPLLNPKCMNGMPKSAQALLGHRAGNSQM